MSVDVTQSQSPDDQHRASERSKVRANPPRELPGYEIRRCLGAGAYGEVWYGVDRNTGRQVAIKFYANRKGVDWSQLAREVEKLVFLSADRYVVQLLDVGWDADPPYYAMEYIERGSLEELCRKRMTLPVAEAVRLFREVAIGLSHAHSKGILHCDLKPANILLDNDLHPRLADFGQARLSHEQTPTLGTLYYMAPEQADLQAVPDARWDVYALGSILYCLLTGSPPHKSTEATLELERAGTLPERLATYRRILEDTPAVTAHRRVAGVDRALADIIEKCLIVEPEQRFGNIQELLDALNARDVARARRPFQVLGLVAPLVLLLIVSMFGWRGYERAVTNTENLAQQRALENNRFAAELAAERVSAEILRYFEIVRDESDRAELRPLLDGVLEANVLSSLNRCLREADGHHEDLHSKQQALLTDSSRKRLNEYVESRLKLFRDQAKARRDAPNFASMFITDEFGTMIAAAYDDESVTSTSVGNNWSHRTYFHGGASDLAPQRPLPQTVVHIHETHLSSVFRSSTTGRQKVAVSTPIYRTITDSNQFVGVLVLTLNLSDLAFFRTISSLDLERFAVLVDGRLGTDGKPTSDTGRILEHPIFQRSVDSQGSLPDSLVGYRVPPETLLNLLSNSGTQQYVDPFHAAPEGALFDRPWIASAAFVSQVQGTAESPADSGLIVLVQESSGKIVEPVRRLAGQLAREGLSALTVVVVVSIGMWYFVSRFLLPTSVKHLVPESTERSPMAGKE